jgi:hypothetical protein
MPVLVFSVEQFGLDGLTVIWLSLARGVELKRWSGCVCDGTSTTGVTAI